MKICHATYFDTMHIPKKVSLDSSKKNLQLEYASGDSYQLSAEFLRVNSPSAEVRGHGNPVLQHGKLGISIDALATAGNYALKINFSDGHDSGLYSWDYLHELACNQQQIWQEYLFSLEQANKFRDPEQSVVRLV